jgi:hypothetical protein
VGLILPQGESSTPRGGLHTPPRGVFHPKGRSTPPRGIVKEKYARKKYARKNTQGKYARKIEFKEKQAPNPSKGSPFPQGERRKENTWENKENARKSEGKHVRKTQGKHTRENTWKTREKRKENARKTQGKPIRNFPHPQGRVIPPKGETKT